MLQDLQDSPFWDMGIPSREELGAILKIQKKEDSTVTANIQGAHGGPFTERKDQQTGSDRADRCGSNSIVMQLLLPAAFLDECGTQLQEEDGRQHFHYVGGEGGTGKSHVIHAIKDIWPA
ncbi:hypothetical protein N657DRAFT_684842 [Parathielavia appendiculata]|uniref:Uncharacterized protein n=1 Tax=Parathielavia appendiculata TaxID=2587402 RepID=A0AAN6TQS3_9PEZI|nr:hypothetical protein N657DRAFT_684842 [Parathielavia appendiculata]